jgi:hypothetical protein
MLPTKRKSAMPDCSQITEEKRVKLKFSIDSTQEKQSSKISEVDSTSEKKCLYIPFGPSLFRRSQKNYCLVHRQIVKNWFWTLEIHLQKDCLQDRGSQQS